MWLDWGWKAGRRPSPPPPPMRTGRDSDQTLRQKHLAAGKAGREGRGQQGLSSGMEAEGKQGFSSKQDFRGHDQSSAPKLPE